MKASDLFVRCLEAERIPYVLGVPGEENADFLLSLESSTIDFIATRHEQGAAFAAATYAKLTGEPLACLGTLGPGATNLVTGVADADMDRVPLLVLTGQGATDRLHKESHQIMDVVALFEPVTRWSISIREADAVPEILRKAVRLTRAARPGAVLVELPEDIAKRETTEVPLAAQPDPSTAARPLDIRAAADALAKASCPMILAGNGVIRSGASEQVRRLAEEFGVPVTTTFMGKGSIPFDSAQCLFTVGIQERDPIVCALGDADLVITLGYDLVEFPPSSWASADLPIVHFGEEPAAVDAAYRPRVEALGNLRESVEALRLELAHRDQPAFAVEAYATLRQELLDEFSKHRDDDTEGSIRPQKLVWDLRAALDAEDVVLSGVGAHKMWLGRLYHCYEPNTCLIPNGFCSMGHPLPGLIGAKLARPDQRCVAVCGDGDFLMNVQEMETIRRLDLDVTVIIWEDHGYGLIAWKQEAEFGTHTDLSFGNPDWIALADAFGWSGERVDNSRDFAAGLDRALAHPGPSLLVAPVDYRENMKLTERLGRQVCRI